MLLLPFLSICMRLILPVSNSWPWNVLFFPKFAFLLAARWDTLECECRAKMWFVLSASAFTFFDRLKQQDSLQTSKPCLRCTILCPPRSCLWATRTMPRHVQTVSSKVEIGKKFLFVRFSLEAFSFFHLLKNRTTLSTRLDRYSAIDMFSLVKVEFSLVT